MITTANKIRGTKVIKLASERTSFPRRTSKVESELVDSTTLALAEQHDFIFVPEFSQLSDEEGLPELASDSEIATRDPTKLDRSTPTHLVRLCEAKLLSPELERQLFRRMNFAKYRAWSLARNPKRSKNSGSLAQIKQFNQHALDDRNRIVSANLRLVVSIAKKFADANNPFDDLLSEGIASLLRAVEKFDYSRGFRFSTYATLAVRRTLYRFVMQFRTDRTRFVATETSQLEEKPAEEAVGTMTEARWSNLQSSLVKLLGKLEPRERSIIRMRFGLDHRRDVMTLQSIAHDLGVCKERVRQLEQRAIAKLRDWASTVDLQSPEE